MDYLDELRSRLVEQVRYGEITLASGEQSNWYIDCRPVTFGDPWLVGHVMTKPTGQRWFDAVGGPAIGAIPIATAIAMSVALGRTFTYRKAKSHGRTDQLVGDVRDGDRVVIVEDVITTGGSVAETIDAVENIGASIVLIRCLVNRGGVESIRGHKVDALFTPKDLGVEL